MRDMPRRLADALKRIEKLAGRASMTARDRDSFNTNLATCWAISHELCEEAKWERIFVADAEEAALEAK